MCDYFNKIISRWKVKHDFLEICPLFHKFLKKLLKPSEVDLPARRSPVAHNLLSLLKMFQEVRTAHGRPLGQKGLDWLQQKKGRVMSDSEESQRPLLSEVGKGPGYTFPSSWGLDACPLSSLALETTLFPEVDPNCFSRSLRDRR